MNSSSSSFWRSLRVGPKLMIIPVFFLIGLGIIVYYSVTVSKAQQENLVVLELVGRQRMLQQNHFSTALLLSKQRATREKLDYIRSVWEDTQNALVDGGRAVFKLNRPETVELSPAPTDGLRKLLQDQMKLIKETIKDTDDLLSTAESETTYNTILADLSRRENDIQELGSEIAKGYTAYMEQQYANLVRVELLVMTGVGLLGVILSWIIARGITGPLHRLVVSAENVAKGNLRIEKLRDEGRDEIAQLSNAFDNMLDNLKELSGKILEVTGNVNSAAAEILASTQQQASSTKEQAATVQEISTTMQEISQSGAEITEKAKQVAASAEAASAASHSGLGAVKTASHAMEGIRTQVEDVANKIVSLSERTNAIGEIVNTVNEIAEQSNLLALNASIEAASAGEQGSRFAVVAGEMRNLAQRAKENTVQVGSILGEIQRGINSTVMLTEEAVKRTDSGKQLADTTQQTIHQMSQTTVESVHAFQQIIGATNQQQIGFDQVTQGMRDIRQAAEQTAVGTAQLEKALANLNELSHQLRTAVSRYQL